MQSPALSPATLLDLARAAGATAVVPVGDGRPAAYRFSGAHDDYPLVDAAHAARCDVALVPRDRLRRQVGVVAMDMDSTLITIECIDEIADMKGIKPEVAAITASAMRGEIDFAASLTQRVALLAGLPVSDLERVYDERLCISPGAEHMLAGFKAAGAITVLVSGGFTFFTDRLKARLGLDVTLANTFEVDGDRLTGRIAGSIVDAAAKARRIRELRARYGGLAVVIGDGANDLPMFVEADVSIAYRAKPVVRKAATHTIDFCGLDAALNLFN